MRIRSFLESDILAIDKIWRDHYSTESSLPSRESRIVDAVVEDEIGRIVGYGQVKHFAEAMFFIDKSFNKRTKVLALVMLMHEALRSSRDSHLDLYAFIKDPAFATLIQKHFDFEIVEDPGELLLRRK